jgi:hypothetical protein
MATRGAANLITNGSTFIGSFQTAPVGWSDGGRTACVINASAYGTIALQLQGPSGAWISVSSSFVSDQSFVFDAPPGQYRLNNSASSTIGCAAVLVGIPYNQ